MVSQASTYPCQIQKQIWVKLIYKKKFESEGRAGKEVRTTKAKEGQWKILKTTGAQIEQAKPENYKCWKNARVVRYGTHNNIDVFNHVKAVKESFKVYPFKTKIFCQHTSGGFLLHAASVWKTQLRRGNCVAVKNEIVYVARDLISYHSNWPSEVNSKNTLWNVSHFKASKIFRRNTSWRACYEMSFFE